MMRRTVGLAVALAAALAVAKPVEWTFPLDASCHQGLAFADGRTGVLVWGGGDTVRLTVGRADLWDHRGGYPWTDEQSYTNIVAAVRGGDASRLRALFGKETPKGEPRNPYMLPLGRVTVRVPGAELRTGLLDPKTGLGTLTFARGDRSFAVELAMGKASRTFAMRFPEGQAFEVATTPALETPVAGPILRGVGFAEPEKFASPSRGGFVQRLPADPSVSLVWERSGRELAVATARGDAPARPVPDFVRIRDESLSHWRTFWTRSAQVDVPDEVVQRVFDYGMYRFGAMTDPDGTPAGLQGAWLEDDRLVPWNGDYHFNINVQECYSPAYRGGHPGNLLPLFRMVRSWWPRLRENARRFCGIDDGFVLPHSVDDRGVCIGGFWTGTIDHASTAWVAAMMFRYVKYARDVDFLKSDAYPFMKGAMNVYRAMMEEREGRLSLPLGPSPEWGAADVRKAVGRDPSFQLAAAHRLARDLIAAAEMLGEKPDPMWLDVERRLPPYLADGSGFMLFEGQPFTESHRHHSHMAALYPFDTLDLADPKTCADVQATYRTWVRKGTGMWTGWCVPWASILHTHAGNSSAAAEMIRCWDAYFCNDGHGSLHNAYRQGFSDMMMVGHGPKGEVIDGSHIMQMDGQCAAVTAILEMMVHEVNGTPEYFRGCPPGWKTVSFSNVLRSDGRRVSGLRSEGKVTIDLDGDGSRQLNDRSPADGVQGTCVRRFVAPQVECPVCSQADLEHAVETLNLCYEERPVKGLLRPYFRPGVCPSGRNDYGSNWWSLDYALAVEGAKWLDFSVGADLVTNLQAVIQSDGRMKLYGGDWSKIVNGKRIYASSLPKFHETVFAVSQMSADAELRQAAFSLLERNLAWWYAQRQDAETKLISAFFEETFMPNTESGPGVYAPLDTNFELVIGSQNAACLADQLGLRDRAAFYRMKAAEISDAIARYCRDPRDGLFRPYLLKERRLARTDQSTMFLAFRLPRSERDDRLMSALTGKDFGWNGIPLCTVSRADSAFFVHDGDYRGNKSWSGSVWTLTNDAVIRALRVAGEEAAAAELSVKTIQAFRGNCAEFLNPDTGRGNGMLRYAWTASQFIRILFEDLFGLSYAPEKGLVCHPAPGFSGTLRNLRLPDGSVRDIAVP